MPTYNKTVKLTEEQQKQVKDAIGVTISELTVEDLEKIVGGVKHDDEAPK